MLSNALPLRGRVHEQLAKHPEVLSPCGLSEASYLAVSLSNE
jgi:hypothetical protein